MTDEFVVPGYVVDPGFYIPTQINTALKPQTTEEFDAGLRWRPLAQVRRHHHLFQQQEQGRDLLQPPDLRERELRQDKTAGGRDVGLRRPDRELSLNLAYSYTEALFDGGQFDGNRIPLVPGNKASAKLSYAIGDWNFSLASVYTGERTP